MTEYWLENHEGKREPLGVIEEKDALDVARRTYPEDTNPDVWLVCNHHDGEEDYVLVPGGPAGEEFTWMPRSMWAEGGPLDHCGL